MAKGHDSISDQSRAPPYYRLTTAGKLSMGMREGGFNVPVVARASIGGWWLQRFEGRRTAGMTVHGAFRPVSTSHNVVYMCWRSPQGMNIT